MERKQEDSVSGQEAQRRTARVSVSLGVGNPLCPSGGCTAEETLWGLMTTSGIRVGTFQLEQVVFGEIEDDGCVS